MLIDIHQHILHQLDDGAQSFEITKKLLLKAQSDQISDIIATPHAIPGMEPFDLIKYYEHFQMAKEWLRENEIPLRIHKGAEIFYTDATVRMLNEGRIPTLAGTKYVLIEFSPRASFDMMCSAVRKLGGAGYSSIFAHIERYQALRKLSNIEILKDEYDILMQVNAETILNPVGLMEKLWLKKVMKEEMIDIVASDTHNLGSRGNVLLESRNKVAKMYDEETADKLYTKTPGIIIRKSK